MRHWFFMGLLLAALLVCGGASAGTMTLSDTVYVFDAGPAPTQSVTVLHGGETYDETSLAPVHLDALAGAVFGVYAKDADGQFVPYADPDEPTRPWRFEVGNAPVALKLPLRVDLYLHQASAPEGFLPDGEMPAYAPLRAGEVLEYVSHREGMQGIWITLTGDGKVGDVPLAGVRFTLAGPDGEYALETNDDGIAARMGLAPGAYTLTQLGAPEGYHIDTPQMAVTIAAGEPLRVQIANSRAGTLTLRALGLAVDGTRTPRLIPIERTYALADEHGETYGQIASGQTVTLPATQAGVKYILTPMVQSADGFASDGQAHEIVIASGQAVTLETAYRSEKGFFRMLHISAEDGQPVGGGTFTLEDAAGRVALTFAVGENGRYEAQTPLMPGRYTLRMVEAAAEHLYAPEPEWVEILPYFDEAATYPVVQVTFASTPVPMALKAPHVTALPQQTLESLFTQDASLSFTLSAFDEAPQLEVVDLQFTFDIPEVPGLTITARRDDGADVRIDRRLPLEGVPAVQRLIVRGTVSYSVLYPVDAGGTLAQMAVSSPFETVAATFLPLRETPVYALTGHIYDENDRPMPGIAVTIADLRTETDPFGAYAFEHVPQDDALQVHAPEGYGVRMERGDAWILPLRTVTGRVTAEGLDGLPVRLSIGDSGWTEPKADGSFAISGVFAQSEPLNVEVPDGVVYHMQRDGDEASVQLYAAASIHARAEDPDGRPVEGVKLSALLGNMSREAVSGPDGQIRLEGLYPGEYMLLWQAPSGMILPGEAPASALLAAGDARELTPVSAMEPSTISGRLLDGDVPYAGVTVTLTPGGVTATTDADGRFVFEGLPTGTYSLALTLPEEAVLLDMPGEIALARPAQRADYAIHAVRPAALAGRIWQDGNDDGLMGYDEGGQSGARVRLLDAAGDAVDEVVTDEGGQFRFAGLVPGAYRIEVLLPEGMLFAREAQDAARLIAGVDGREAASGTITVASGQERDGLIAGAVEAGAISGTVWHDVDGDGLLTDTEKGMPAATVTITRDGMEPRTQQTDEAGAFRFEDLRAGTYRLRVTLADGMMFTREAAYGADGVQSAITEAADPAEATVSLRRWRMEETVHIGMQREASVTAQVWFDADASGIPQADGQAGIAVTLTQADAPGRGAVLEGETDADGRILFEGLRPGRYTLRYRLPQAEGWGFTAGIETGPEEGWGAGEAVLLADGQTLMAPPVGVTRLGVIAGIVFEDADFSGLREETEGGLAATVALLDMEGNVLAAAQTAQDGAYRFDGLTVGFYAVRVTLAEGYAFTQARSDATSYNSDLPQTDEAVSQTDSLYLPLGETLLIDAGGYRPASVTGCIWQDADATGLYAQENPPLAGVPVALMAGDVQVDEAQTDESGAYHFQELKPGQYAVRITLPEGMRFSRPPAGDGRRSRVDDTEALTGETAAFALTSGQALTQMDAGAVYTGDIAGAMHDLKTGEGLAGVTVMLLEDGVQAKTTVTSADGLFRFDALRPGEREIRYALPEGFTLSAETAHPVMAVVEQRETTQLPRADCLPEGVIAGRVWVDGGTNDPVPEAEALLSGVEVRLYAGVDADDLAPATDAAGVASPVPLAVLTTDAGGAYRFEKLLPGAYRVRFGEKDEMLYYDGEGEAAFELSMGEERALDARLFTPAEVAGAVWEDLDHDGLRGEEEPPLEAAAVSLVMADGRVLRTAQTAADGSYRFEGLPPETVSVRFELPDGYLFTSSQGGGSWPPQSDEATGQTEPIALTMGARVTDVLAGALRHTRIGDLVWLDENGNGLQDTAEMGLGGIVVRLWPEEGGDAPMMETTTDASGRYRFDAVRPGRYRVSFVLGDAYRPAQAVKALGQINSKLTGDYAPEMFTEVFTAQSGRHMLAIDAGLVAAVQATEATEAETAASAAATGGLDETKMDDALVAGHVAESPVQEDAFFVPSGH